MENTPDDQKVISIKSFSDGGNGVVIKVMDNGCGILKENLTEIFNHGYTTKENGFGYGLHSCATSMLEINGAIKAHSDGPDKGAIFELTFLQ